MRREALIGVGTRMIRIEHQQLVQHCRAASPMAQNKQWRLSQLRLLDSVAEQCALEHAGEAVERTGQRDRGYHRPAQWRYREAISHQQSHPGQKVHTVPKPRRPARVTMQWSIGVGHRGTLLGRFAHSSQGQDYWLVEFVHCN